MRTPRREDIGGKVDGDAVAFRPVKVHSEDYAAHEYGVTPDALAEFVQKANQELNGDRKGRLKPFPGKLKRG
jgi:hypothetical protein